MAVAKAGGGRSAVLPERAAGGASAGRAAASGQDLSFRDAGCCFVSSAGETAKSPATVPSNKGFVWAFALFCPCRASGRKGGPEALGILARVAMCVPSSDGCGSDPVAFSILTAPGPPNSGGS